MRMSCNGCRVLRKGCSEDCSLRPCLQWIKCPESQANATVFLAKFYGRAGLFNLLNAGPVHLRPAIFKSLLHEACGRMINPIQGSVGLITSANWHRCQEAVEAVLEGSPIPQGPIEDESTEQINPIKSCDIRHLSKNPNAAHRVRTRNRLKRQSASSAVHCDDGAGPTVAAAEELMFNEPVKFSIAGWGSAQSDELGRAPSHDSLGSVETVEPTLVVNPDESGWVDDEEEDEMDLDLTLGFNSAKIFE